MGNNNIKQKEQVNQNPDDNIFVKPIGKSRKEELADRRKQRGQASYDDIKNMLQNVGGHIVTSEEYLPPGDWQTHTGEEWKKLNEKSYNRRNNVYYSWH
jgi:hypothetical protein